LQGRLREHHRLAALAAKIESARGVEGTAEELALDSVFVDIWFGGRVAEGTRRLDAVSAAMPPSTFPGFEIALYGVAGRPDRSRALLDRYDAAAASDTTSRRLASSERHGALAEIAIAERRYDEAIREYQLSDTLYDGGPTLCAVCILPRLGQAYDLAGKPDDAIATFERYVSSTYAFRFSSGTDPQYLAGTYKRLGELHEAKGNTAKAAAYYGKFIDLWKDADPQLQPKVTEVRQRLALLQARERR
jgi:tetratricopeptide (TPR) repeat protein